MLNAVLNIQKSSTSTSFLASLSLSFPISLFLCFCHALLLASLFLFQMRASTSPLQNFIFISSLSEMEESVENGLRAFPSAISKPLLPLPVSTTPVRQLSLTHTEKITALHSLHTHTHTENYSTALLTHTHTHTHTQKITALHSLHTHAHTHTHTQKITALHSSHTHIIRYAQAQTYTQPSPAVQSAWRK